MSKLHDDFEGSLMGDDGKLYMAGDEVPDGVVSEEQQKFLTGWTAAGVDGSQNGEDGADWPTPPDESTKVAPAGLNPLDPDADDDSGGEDAEGDALQIVQSAEDVKKVAKKTAASRRRAAKQTDSSEGDNPES